MGRFGRLTDRAKHPGAGAVPTLASFGVAAESMRAEILAAIGERRGDRADA